MTGHNPSELLPCRACGGDCTVQGFSGDHIMGRALIWVCVNNKRMGGDCPNEMAYLSAEAWNDRHAQD